MATDTAPLPLAAAAAPPKAPPPVAKKPTQAAMARARLAQLAAKAAVAGTPAFEARPKELGIAAGLVADSRYKLQKLQEQLYTAQHSVIKAIESGNLAAMIQCFTELASIQEKVAPSYSGENATGANRRLIDALNKADTALAATASADGATASADGATATVESPMDRAEELVQKMGYLTDFLVEAIHALREAQGHGELTAEVKTILDAIFVRFGERFAEFCRSAMEALTTIKVEMQAVVEAHTSDREEHTLAVVLAFSKGTSISDDVARNLRPKAEALSKHDQGIPALDAFMAQVLEFVEWGEMVTSNLA